MWSWIGLIIHQNWKLNEIDDDCRKNKYNSESFTRTGNMFEDEIDDECRKNKYDSESFTVIDFLNVLLILC